MANWRSNGLRQRAWFAGIVAALLAVGVLVFAVFQFGRLDPSPPSMQDHPNTSVPGKIAYADSDGCIVQIDASGVSKQALICDEQSFFGKSSVAWLDHDTIGFQQYTGGPGGATWVEFDVATGERRAEPASQTQFKQPNLESINGEYANVGEGGRLLVSKGSAGPVETIADFDVPDNRWPYLIGWSPDGAWLMLGYSGPRESDNELWIVSRDGSFKGTLATDVAGYGADAVSWWIDRYEPTPPVGDQQRR